MPRVRARLKRAELGRRRVQGLVALSAVAALLTAAPVAAQRARRVEGIAAFVGGTAPGNDTVAILRSDVTLHARLALAQETARLPTGPLPAPLLAAALDEIIGEVLIAREADRLRAARPTDARIEEERARIEARVGGPERLAAILRGVGATPEEVEAIARRRAYVDAFLRANLEGSTVISDGQVERVYETGEHPFARRPLEDVRDVLRAWIAAQVLQRDVRRWIEVLRSRSTVRVIAEWRA